MSNKLTTEPRLTFTKKFENDTITTHYTISSQPGESTLNGIYGRKFRGDYFPSYITFSNLGQKSSKGTTEISDVLNNQMYITEDNIKKMLLEDTATIGSYTYHPGDWLTITITNASLYTQGTTYMTASDENEASKYNVNYSGTTTITQTPVTITAANDKTILSSNTYTIVLKKVDMDIISITCTGTDKDWSKTIGPDGDFETIEEAYADIGFLVTNATTYNLVWAPPSGELVIPPGNATLTLTVRSSFKTTPMITTGDSANQFGTINPNYMRYTGSGSNRVYYFYYRFSNTAYVTSTDYVGATVPVKRSASTNFTPPAKAELNVSKTVSPTNSISYTDIKDIAISPLYTLTFRNYSDTALDKVGISDILEGPQMVIVPYEQNKNNPSIFQNLDLEDDKNIVEYNDVKYIVLRPVSDNSSNAKTVYSDVYFGSTTAQSGYAATDNLMLAKSITVEWKNSAVLKGNYVSSIIEWELDSLKGTRQIYYNSHVAPGDEYFDYSDGIENFEYYNTTWLGDHQGHRSYATIKGVLQKRTYVPPTPPTPSFILEKAVRLSNENRLALAAKPDPGDTIKYELSIYTYNNTEAANRLYNGSTLKDNLPKYIDWTTDGDGIKNGIIGNISYLTNAPDEIKLYYIDPETNERSDYIFDTPVELNLTTTNTSSTTADTIVKYYIGHWSNPSLVGNNGEKAWALKDGIIQWSENLYYELADNDTQTPALERKRLKIWVEAKYPSDEELLTESLRRSPFNQFVLTRPSGSTSSYNITSTVDQKPYTLFKKRTDENYEPLTEDTKITAGSETYYDICFTNIDEKSRGDIVKGIQLVDILPGLSDTLPWRTEQKNSEDSLYGLVKNISYSIEGEKASEAELTYTTAEGETITYDFDTKTWSNEELAKDIWYITSTNAFSSNSTTSYYYYRNQYPLNHGYRRFANTHSYIRWNNNFKLFIPGGCTFHIYINLKFPSDENVWQKASTYLSSSGCENWFYLYKRLVDSTGKDSVYYSSSSSAIANKPLADYVSHNIVGDYSAVLRKGVLDTGWTRATSTTTYKYTTRNSRKTFANSPFNAVDSTIVSGANISTVTYYVALYNSGTERMYFGDFHDKLPKGFLFDSICTYYDITTTSYSSWATTSGGVTTYSGRVGYYGALTGRTLNTAQTNIYPANYTSSIVSINDSDFWGTKSYLNTKITASTYTNDDGIQFITFKSDINYLEPGQVIVFGYNVKIKEYAETGDTALNTIAVAYNNVYNKPLAVDDPAKIVSANPRDGKNTENNRIEKNDGNCQQMTTEEVAAFGFDTSEYTDDNYNNDGKGNWLVSEVNIMRQITNPGIQKTVGGYNAYNIDTLKANPNTVIGYIETLNNTIYGSQYLSAVQRDQVMNWKIRVYNGFSDVNMPGNSMSPYTLVDAVESPYAFTGRVYYSTFYENSNLGIPRTAEGSTQYLFTIGQRAWDNADKEAETGVRIVKAGNNIYSTTPIVPFGEWFDFGTGRVKIDRTESTNPETGTKIYAETMTIELTDDIHSIADGRYHEYKISTQYSGNTLLLGEMVHNNIKLYPNPRDSYIEDTITQGKPFTEQSNNPEDPVRGIESGAGIMVSHGYATSSSKDIKEKTVSNSAFSNNPDNNTLTLSTADAVFTYELKVETPSENPLSQITLIDHLPEPDDTSAFNPNIKRDSRFSIGFSEEPNFKVYLKPGKNAAETLLNNTNYTLQVSEKTSFEAYDWTSATVANDGWNTLIGNAEEDAQLIAKARSVRVILQRNIPAASTIRITFDAVVDDTDVKPGDTAWNSFGYRCIVIPTAGTEVPIEAQSQSSGVKFPYAPKLSKSLKDGKNNDYTPEEDITFGYIIYKGSAIADFNSIAIHHKVASEIETLEKTIFNALVAANRDFIYVPVTVEEGTSETVVNLDGNLYCSTYDETTRNWVDKLDANNEKIPFSWANNTSYTVFELPITNYNYSAPLIESGTTSKANNYSFTHKSNQSVLVKGTNTYNPELITIRGEKTWVNDKKDGSDRPETITLRILDDNNEKQGEMTATAETSWTYHYDGLKKYNSDGTEISYSLAEETVDGYTTTYEKVNSTTINVKNTMITHSLTLTKTVEGNMGDRTASFGFTIDGIGGRTVYVDGTKVEIPENEKLTLNLKHGDSTTIALIPADAVLTVTEAEGNTGYLVTYTSTGESDPVTGKSKAGFSLDGDTVMAFTNTKDTGVPTGVFLKPEVWISMLVTALLLGILYIISKIKHHPEL